MSDLIQDLYETHVYPAMSHPASDPAVSAVAAMLGGLETKHPSGARILEIGCGSGLNLIPLAMRWPGSCFVGMDLSGPSVREARLLAEAAGLQNITFHAADLREFDPDGMDYDYIIAHGFFSWVPDEVKLALFDFCQRHLAPEGIATISFNLECGWQPRFPVIEKVRAIMRAGAGDLMEALAILREVTDANSPEVPIIEDMMAKGADILVFDDFGPVNDPWPLDRFIEAAGNAGLRWLGESDPSKNLPSQLDDEAFEKLRKHAPDPLSLQMAADAAVGRTFRSGVLCRADAAVESRFALDRLFGISVRAGARPCDPEDLVIYETVAGRGPVCSPMREIRAALLRISAQDLARRVCDGIYQGWLLPRIEPVVFSTSLPERPRMDRFRLECARRGLPVVDVWHRPCSFPPAHYRVLAAMDGTRDLTELAGVSKNHCPELALEPWLRHLAARGIFA